MTRRRAKLSGQKSLFRRKVRKPVSITLTKRHHRLVRRAMKRLKLTRADLLALLIEQHADTLTALDVAVSRQPRELKSQAADEVNTGTLVPSGMTPAVPAAEEGARGHGDV